MYTQNGLTYVGEQPDNSKVLLENLKEIQVMLADVISQNENLKSEIVSLKQPIAEPSAEPIAESSAEPSVDTSQITE